ncbi:MAG: phytanoyl-CoA dioxygenase family protein [Candidatus Poribacteria bacterium]|nr:phytanoyl-CoA dioxygenase family protein [Candidatus Poribacteria bacterium]
MAYLTDADKVHFKTHGYVVIRGVLDQPVIDAALDLLWHNIEADRNDPASWVGQGYRTVSIGNEDAIRRTIYDDPVFAMAEELVGQGSLRREGGTSPHLNFPNPDQEWHEPTGHLDGYHTPTNGVPKGTVSSFTLGATVYLGKVESRGGGFTVWPRTHQIWAEYFRYHDLDSLQGGVAPFDIGKGVEITGDAGDVCLWHNQLSHTAGPNLSRNLRIALIGRLRRKDLDQIKFETPENMWTYWEGLN